MKEKMISVIIPVYNNPDFLGDSLKKINSDLADIIIIDDGSTDNTLELCKQYEKKHSNVKVYHQENSGPAKAREYGVYNAETKYIMFLDSDDSYEENTIDRIVELIEKYNEPDLIRFRYVKVPEIKQQDKYFNEKEKYVKKEEFKQLVYPMYLSGFMLNAVWSNCVKRDILTQAKLSDLEQTLKFGEDMILSLKIFSTISNAVFIDDVLYRYTFRESSTTHTKDYKKIINNTKNAIYVYTKLFEYLIDWDMYNPQNVRAVQNRIKKETDDLLDRLNTVL